MDFIYEDFFIPKGTHVHPSQWFEPALTIYDRY